MQHSSSSTCFQPPTRNNYCYRKITVTDQKPQSPVKTAETRASVFAKALQQTYRQSLPPEDDLSVRYNQHGSSLIHYVQGPILTGSTSQAQVICSKPVLSQEHPPVFTYQAGLNKTRTSKELISAKAVVSLTNK
jgi:hypothetical protein